MKLKLNDEQEILMNFKYTVLQKKTKGKNIILYGFGTNNYFEEQFFNVSHLLPVS